MRTRNARAGPPACGALPQEARLGAGQSQKALERPVEDAGRARPLPDCPGTEGRVCPRSDAPAAAPLGAFGRQRPVASGDRGAR